MKVPTKTEVQGCVCECVAADFEFRGKRGHERGDISVQQKLEMDQKIKSGIYLKNMDEFPSPTL